MILAATGLGVTALVVLAAACAGGRTDAPFHAGAAEDGYTVLYDPNGLPPHTTDGPCVQLVPNAGVKQAETGIGQVDCTAGQSGLNVQETELDGNRIAVWGIPPAGTATVTVADRLAIVRGHTYLGVLPKPAGTYVVVALDRSGRPVDSLSSDRLPPPVPNVSSSQP